MADSKPPTEAGGLPLQGPHWSEDRSRAAAAPPAPLRLVLQPWGKVIELNQSEIVIGRHSEADLSIRLPDVSRRHCRLVFADNSWQIFDLQSLNGIFVNEQRVQHATLQHRDTIRVGTVTLQVDLHPGDQTQHYPTATSANAEERILDSIRDALPEPGPDRLAS